MSITSNVAQLVVGGLYTIVYRDAAGEISERDIEIEAGFVGKCGPCYRAYCHLRGESRCFAVARILFAAPAHLVDRTTFGAAPEPPVFTGEAAANWMRVLPLAHLWVARA